MGLGHSPRIVTDGLTLCIDSANQRSRVSSSQLKDMSRNSNDLVFVNGASYTDESFYFDGSNDYAYIKNLNYGNGKTISEMTFSAFVKNKASFNYSGGTDADDVDTANWSLIDFDRSEVFSFWCDINGTLAFAGKNSDVEYYDMTSSNIISRDEWHHVGITYSCSNQEIIFYIDGIPDNVVTDTSYGTINPLGAGVTRYGIVGDGSEAGTENGLRNDLYYQGEISNLLFYDNKALTPREMFSNFLCFKEKFNVKQRPVEEVFLYDAVNYSGTGNWLDESGKGNPAFIANNSPTYDSSGYFDLNGTNQYFSQSYSHPMTANSDRSQQVLTAVVNFDTVAGNRAVFEIGGGTNGATIYVNNGTLHTGFRDGGTFYSVSTTVSTGQWYHIGLRYRDSTVSLFLDGTKIGSTSAPSCLARGTSSPHVGYEDGGAGYLDGKISYVSIINEKMSDDDMLSNYNKTMSGRFS